MHRHLYCIVFSAAFLFAGCDDVKQVKGQKESSNSMEKKVEQVRQHSKQTDIVVGKKPESSKGQTVAIEMHGAKEEKHIAKIPSTIAPTPLPPKKEQPSIVASVDPVTLYKSCVACHGIKGEKKALGKSEAIGGWSALKVEEALKEYRAKRRNVHGMGAVMQGQAAKLSDDDIKTLGEYIEKLH